MYRVLPPVVLKDGERVEAGVVDCPDPEWADRIEALLGHKGDLWRWQNRCCARQDLGIDVRYYLLHREGTPFANMLTATYQGVGHFGHVFTRVEDRRKGAANQLMGLLMEDFRQRGGQALFLGTGFDSPPYHIYGAHGFTGLEPGNGQMDYYTSTASEFRAAYFRAGPTKIGEIAWRHWPASAAMFTAPVSERVRCPGLGLHGRGSTEGPFLDVLKQAEEGSLTHLVIAERVETGAVVALARCGPHPLWPGRQMLDLFGWPAEHGDRVAVSSAEQDMASCLQQLAPQLDAGCVCYTDGGEAREAVLSAAGFQPASTLPEWVSEDTAGRRHRNVTLWLKS